MRSYRQLLLMSLYFVSLAAFTPCFGSEKNSADEEEKIENSESRMATPASPITIETEEERFYRLRQQQDEKLQIAAKETSKICSTDINIRVEWKNITADILEKNSVYGYCGEALDAITSLCAISDGQKAVKQQIHEVLCTVGKEFKVSLKQSALILQMDWAGQQDTMRKVYRYLLNNLQ
ncbi:MAG: hypothetical protein ACOYK8_09470 [Alphaproteobacteria bacterium]